MLGSQMLSGKKYRMLRIAGLLFGSVNLLFGISVILSRLNIEVSGTIVSAETVRLEKGPLGNPNRSYTRYVVADSLSGDTSEYRAASTDSDLSRKLNVGEVLKKSKGHLYYEVEGQRIDDFPRVFYAVLCSVGAAFILLGVYAHRKLKEPNHSAQADAAEPR